MLLSNLKLAKSAISDDECGIADIKDPETNNNEFVTDNEVPEAKPQKVDYQGRARPDQKSLLVIFDATGSMGPNLAQVKASARDIVVALAEHAENPIYNYILSVYRDPPTNPGEFCASF